PSSGSSIAAASSSGSRPETRTARGTRRAGLAPALSLSTPFPLGVGLSARFAFETDSATARKQCLRRVAGEAQRWQDGQYHVPRPPARIFSIGVLQRSHGSPSRP